MLSERTRNVIVGLTMLGALAALMEGIFLLGRFPSLHSAEPYTVTLVAPNSGGLAAGNRVDFNGVSIGSVRAIEISPDMNGVHMILSIDRWFDLPSNAQAQVGKPYVGSPFVSFYLPSAPAGAARPTPAAAVPKDGSAMLAAIPADSGLIPQSVIDHLNAVATHLETLLEKRNLNDFEKEDPNTRVANISILVQRLDRLGRNLDMYIGDPKMQEQFRQIMENIRDTTANVRDVAKRLDGTVTHVNDAIDSTSQKIGAAATQASATLDTTRTEIARTTQRLADLIASLQKTTDAIAEGKGTAGKFISDPRLYDGLVDVAKSLKSTTDDLNLLIRKWSEEGVPLHLK